MKKGVFANERVGQNLSFGNTKNQAGRKFILSAMGMKPIPRTEGPKGGFEGRGGRMPAIEDFRLHFLSAIRDKLRMFRIPITDQSFRKVVSATILAIYKKKNVFPLFKGQKFPIQELFRNLCCGDESQSKRAVDGQKQTSRPGQAARQDRQAGRWAGCQARCPGDSGPIMEAKSGETAGLLFRRIFWGCWWLVRALGMATGQAAGQAARQGH